MRQPTILLNEENADVLLESKEISNAVADFSVNTANILNKFGLYKVCAHKKYLLSTLSSIKDFKFPKISFLADGVSFCDMKICFTGLALELKQVITALACLSLIVQAVADPNSNYFTDQPGQNATSYYKLEWFAFINKSNLQIIQACNGSLLNNTIEGVFDGIYNVTAIVLKETGQGEAQIVGSLFRASTSMAKKLFEQCIEHNMDAAVGISLPVATILLIIVGAMILLGTCLCVINISSKCCSKTPSNISISEVPTESSELLAKEPNKYGV